MSEKAFEEPRVHPELLTKGDLVKLVEEEDYITQQIFDGDFLEGVEKVRIHFDGCLFRNVIFSDCHFPHLDFLDCIFDHCDLSNIECSEGSIHRCRFEQCRMTGSDISANVIHNTAFIKNTGKYINFSFTKFKQVTMEDNDFTSGGFNGCEFKKIIFTDCKLDQCEFVNAVLDGVNWKTCSIDEIMITIENLRGLTVSSEQAANIAQLFGLTIE